ncbi:hypothetical protein ACFX13_012193 [Malus domestica]
MGYYCKGIRDKGGTISQRLFTSKSKNQDCVIGSDCSKVIKCEVSFDSSMIINAEDAGNLGLHQLEACMDKNRKHERKFTFSRFGNGCCVVCCVVLDRDYCKGIRDKDGGSKFRIYTVGGKSLDLHLLFVEVTSRGGLDKVIRDHKWKAVIVAFKFPTTITSVSFVLRKYYLSLLYHFEQAYYLHKEVFSTPVLKPVSEDLFNGSATVKESAEVQFGSSIMGTIDGKFDGGYVVTVNLGSDELKGVLYHAPTATYVSQSFLDMPTRRNRKRSRLALRDPSRPKSKRSSYNFFFAEHYARIANVLNAPFSSSSIKFEYFVSNVLTAKSDVYGVGMVLLELLTGKRALFRNSEDGGPMVVVEYAGQRIVAGKLQGMLDQRVGKPDPKQGEAVELVAYTAMHYAKQRKLDFCFKGGVLLGCQMASSCGDS